MDFAGSYGRGVLRGLIRYATLRPEWEFLMPPLYTPAPSPPKRVEGAIAMLHTAHAVEAFRSTNTPVVNTARTMSAGEMHQHGLHSVIPDDRAVGVMAFNYFFNRGFRTFAFVGHPDALWSVERCNAFVDCCSREAVPVTTVSTPDQLPDGWLATLAKPCAVLAANDRYAWSAIDQAREASIAVPDQVAILGVDNDTLFSELMRPSLSSVDVGAEKIGFEAARVLDDLMNGKRPQPRAIEIAPLGVITRNSTDVLSIQDDAVADAVRFIRANAMKPFDVAQLLGHLTISRRNLERRFRKLMGRSLLDEIRRVRIDRACRLLRDSDADVHGIAMQCGFVSQARFCTVFREQMNMPPTHYRRNARPEHASPSYPDAARPGPAGSGTARSASTPPGRARC